jgi:hypothetical protein
MSTSSVPPSVPQRPPRPFLRTVRRPPSLEGDGSRLAKCPPKVSPECVRNTLWLAVCLRLSRAVARAVASTLLRGKSGGV